MPSSSDMNCESFPVEFTSMSLGIFYLRWGSDHTSNSNGRNSLQDTCVLQAQGNKFPVQGDSLVKVLSSPFLHYGNKSHLCLFGEGFFHFKHGHALIKERWMLFIIRHKKTVTLSSHHIELKEQVWFHAMLFTKAFQIMHNAFHPPIHQSIVWSTAALPF